MKLEDLKVGDMLITNARKVNGGKVQIEFVQKLKIEGKSKSLLSMLNKSDERFANQDAPRYAWMSGTPVDIKATLNIDTTSLVEIGDVLELNILNHLVDGDPLNIRIKEYTEGTEYDAANFEKRAKRAGKGGDFITTKDGQYIYTTTDVVVGEAKHILITETVRENVVKAAIDSALNA